MKLISKFSIGGISRRDWSAGIDYTGDEDSYRRLWISKWNSDLANKDYIIYDLSLKDLDSANLWRSYVSRFYERDKAQALSKARSKNKVNMFDINVKSYNRALKLPINFMHYDILPSVIKEPTKTELAPPVEAPVKAPALPSTTTPIKVPNKPKQKRQRMFITKRLE